MKYRPDIDGLRALALLPVMLFHADFRAFSGGFIGVDIFFVISGYLITQLITERLIADNFSLTDFYLRRARRILPALLFVALCCIPFAWLWMRALQLQEFSQSLIAINLFSSNILFWLQSGYFSPAAELKPLLHTWSLGVEDQFYLFFPIALLLMWRSSRVLVITGVLLTAAVSLMLTHWGSINHPSATFYLLPTRAWELLLGSACALLLLPDNTSTQHRHTNWQRKLNWLAPLGLAGIVYAVFAFNADTAHPSLSTLVPTLGTACVIVFGAGNRFSSALLCNRLMVGIGLISYSGYLWHQPLLAFAKLSSLREVSEFSKLLLLLASLFIAYFSWKYIETPFRNRQKISNSLLLKLLACGTLATLLAGLWGMYYVHALKQRNDLPTKTQQWLDLDYRLRINSGIGEHCDRWIESRENCRTNTSDTAVPVGAVALWGDSFAMHWMEALVASQPSARVVQMTKRQCGPLLDLAPVNLHHSIEWAKNCLARNARVLEEIKNSADIHWVLLSSNLRNYSNNKLTLLTADGELVSASPELALESLRKTLDELAQAGKQALFISPLPSTGEDIGACLAKASNTEKPLTVCNLARAQVEILQHHELYIIATLAKEYSVLNVADFLCNREHCSAGFNGIFIYRDAAHLSLEGSSALGKKLKLYQRITQNGPPLAPQ